MKQTHIPTKDTEAAKCLLVYKRFLNSIYRDNLTKLKI